MPPRIDEVTLMAAQNDVTAAQGRFVINATIAQAIV